jgi:hypothetical protein
VQQHFPNGIPAQTGLLGNLSAGVSFIEHFLANHRLLSNVVIHGNPPCLPSEMRPRSNKPTNFAALFSQITRASRPFAKRQPIVCLAQIVAIRRRPGERVKSTRGQHSHQRNDSPPSHSATLWQAASRICLGSWLVGNRAAAGQ